MGGEGEGLRYWGIRERIIASRVAKGRGARREWGNRQRLREEEAAKGFFWATEEYV